ncbi:hypothetical protein Tco_0533117 [Tanacetum coccineum]
MSLNHHDFTDPDHPDKVYKDSSILNAVALYCSDKSGATHARKSTTGGLLYFGKQVKHVEYKMLNASPFGRNDNGLGSQSLTFIHGLCINMDPHEFPHVYLVLVPSSPQIPYSAGCEAQTHGYEIHIYTKSIASHLSQGLHHLGSGEETVLDLQKAKDAQAKEIVALKKRIQRLERRKMSRPTSLKRLSKVGMSRELSPLKTRRVLVLEVDVMHVEAKVDGKDDQSKKPDDSTIGEAVTTYGIDNTAGIYDSAVPTTSEEITLAQTLNTDYKPSSKDKGKGIMIEPEVPLKRKDQIALDEQIARDIQAKLDAELLEEQKLARKQEEEANIALIESWENTQAMMEADRLLAERLQSKEREELTDEEKAKLFMELMEKRRKHFAALRAQEKRNRPPTKAQKRTQMSTYLKHMGGYTYKQLKGKSFDEIQKLFDKEMKRVNTFVAMGSEVQESKEKKEEGREETAKGSRKKMLGRKRAGKEQQKESSKKQKVEEEKESEEVEEDDEVELKKLLVIKKDEDIAIDAIPLATKLPVIIDYKLHKEGMLVHYQLIRADGFIWSSLCKIQKMNIKFRGGLLGLKRLHGFLEVTAAQVNEARDSVMSSDSAASEEPDSPKAASASPDYVPSPEEPEQAPPSPDYVPGPKYPEYLASADDEIVAEDQPYANYASPPALSPGYPADSDPEEDPEDGPVDYSTDGGDDDDDDDSSDDDEEEEEEEHLALADSVITPAVDYVPSSKETEPF